MNKLLLLLIACLNYFMAYNQAPSSFTTPNTGVNWTLGDISNIDPNSVGLVGNVFQIYSNIVVSTNDTLTLLPGDSINLKTGVIFQIFGTLQSIGTPTSTIFIEAEASNNQVSSIYLHPNSKGNFENTIFTACYDLICYTDHLTINNCKFLNNRDVAIGLINSSPTITNNLFKDNFSSAISSIANGISAPTVEGNIFMNNARGVANRAQVQFGPTGVDTLHTLHFINNEIIGNLLGTNIAGGISLENSSLAGPNNFISKIILENNSIHDNRYGIIIDGNFMNIAIKNNIISKNINGGSISSDGYGIGVINGDSTQQILATSNVIDSNRIGVSIYEGNINLGDNASNPGHNLFSNNIYYNEVIAIYNNSPNKIMAQHNCWDEQETSSLTEVAEMVIDQEDSSSLGEVIYDPIDCLTNSISSPTLDQVLIYPNPVSDKVYIKSDIDIKQITIFSVTGKKVAVYPIEKHLQQLSISLNPGIYSVVYEINRQKIAKKLVVE